MPGTDDGVLRPEGRMRPAQRLALALLNLGGLLLCGSLVALLRGFSLSWLHNASIALNGLAMLSLLLALGAVCGVARACKVPTLLRTGALHPAPRPGNAIPEMGVNRP